MHNNPVGADWQADRHCSKSYMQPLNQNVGLPKVLRNDRYRP